MRPTDDDYGSDHTALHGLRHHEPLYTDALHNEDVAHEHSDVSMKTLFAFALGLSAVVAVTFLLMAGLFKVFEDMAKKNDPVLSPHALPADQLPPMPRVQDNLNEPAVLRKHRERELEDLAKAGIPIDQAKKQLLESGLPVRADAPTDPWLGSRWAGPTRGESSSGRKIPVKPSAPGAQQGQ